jgi:RNA polymerase sigma factor (sigma-70 family)
MVWAVCRRILAHHDAEDAFQATFLVLVRKAASIRPREMVGNWLYGVARQTALKARSMAQKRRTREKQMQHLPEPSIQGQTSCDLHALIDQELNRLPDRYRAVIILCDLEGKTRKEAAWQLGLPEGTVASRLARARSVLAKRLIRHGLTGDAARSAPQQHSPAWVPPAVLSSTIRVVTSVAATNAAPMGAIPPTVAALTDGVVRSMLIHRLKKAALVLLLLSLVSFTTVMVVRGQADQGKDEPQPEAAAKLPKASYARFRLDVEISGTLRITDKGATITAPWPVFLLSDPNKESVDHAVNHAYNLDFSKAKDLQKAAKELDGMTVVVHGLSELRQLVPDRKPGPGSGYSGPNPPAIPSPYWTVHDTIAVTGLALAEDK